MKLVPYRLNYKKITPIDPTTRKQMVDEKTGEPLVVYYPIIPLLLSSPTKTTRPTEGLLDSGADEIVLPRGLADYLELDLKSSNKPMKVASGDSVPRFVAEVTLTIGRAGRFCDPIKTEVCVPEEGDAPILIGRRPVFGLFEITFIEAERRLKMEPYRKKK